MQVVILAAGMGKRLKDITNDKTKCMVKVNDTTLIEHSLNIVTQYDISKIVIVTGYKADKLTDLLGNSFNGVKIEYIYNEVYSTTNNIYSLYLAKEYLNKEDTLLLESDLIFEKRVIDKILNCPGECSVLVDKYESWMDGTVVKTDGNNRVTGFLSKDEFDFSDVDSYYKTVNIYKFSKDFMESHYLPFLEAYCKSEGLNGYYEQILKVIAFIDRDKISICKLEDGEKWYEIDDKLDLHNAETLFSKDISKYEKRYGGYWRFPKLLDFCYLVNPYFPTPEMTEEFKCYFDPLLRQYPSGLDVQNTSAAKMFDCKTDNIVTGNGAAELINALMQIFKDKKTAVPFPTFQEYPNRLDKNNVIPLLTEQPDFSYNSDIFKSCKDADVFLLINPDNPSGNFIPREEVLELCRYLKERDKILIVDESFVDFSTEGNKNSIIDNKIISELDNLIIIKSISKSYGVPGIRLGVMISGNKKIIEETRKRISIWNINSYAEFFLQIFNKYQNDYQTACRQIADERDWFYHELKKISFLRVIPSQANYFLCELKRYDTAALSNYLINRNILIKDCSKKAGFDGKSYIRIAVRNRQDNQRLISAMNDAENNL